MLLSSRRRKAKGQHVAVTLKATFLGQMGAAGQETSSPNCAFVSINNLHVTRLTYEGYKLNI